jgi:hypothetical protein
MEADFLKNSTTSFKSSKKNGIQNLDVDLLVWNFLSKTPCILGAAKKTNLQKKNQTLKLYTIHYTYIYLFVIFAEPKI